MLFLNHNLGNALWPRTEPDGFVTRIVLLNQGPFEFFIEFTEFSD